MPVDSVSRWKCLQLTSLFFCNASIEERSRHHLGSSQVLEEDIQCEFKKTRPRKNRSNLNSFQNSARDFRFPVLLINAMFQDIVLSVFQVKLFNGGIFWFQVFEV